MNFGLEDLERCLTEPEGERLEFKEAKSNFHFEKLAKYCAALANEGGGKILLGITDRRPRTVVGSSAFEEPGRTIAGLIERLRVRISWTELHHAGRRVLIFEVPARAAGTPIQFDGVYWSRAGDELRPLPPDELRRAFAEGEADFSADLEPSATLSDLDPELVESFRHAWVRKSGNENLATLTPGILLSDAELVRDGTPTRAALVMLGTSAALGRHLPQAELIFEYRSNEASTPYQQRVEFRRGFLGYLDDLWKQINLRNEVLQYQEGFFVADVPVFNEMVVREGILNALTHRDYRLAGSVFVRQFPRRLEIVSPGSFPPGVSPSNILWRQSPRNRRIAEGCSKCGLVERSGQGANRMFEESIKQGKATPDFNGSDQYQVSLSLLGEIQHPEFLRFLEKIGKERLANFKTADLLLLDAIQRESPIDEAFRDRLPHLLEQGVIEQIGRGRGARFVPSRKFYSFIGSSGTYTRKRGLDRETNKALLEKHLLERIDVGAGIKELEQVLPALSRKQILSLLVELRAEKKVHSLGTRRWTRWLAGAGS